jgi:hypothetical protein
MLKLFGYAFAENDADLNYYYGRSSSLNLYVHILTSNDSIADDTCLGIPKCCWILQPATGETYRYIADGQYTTDAITVDSCQTLNSNPFGGFDHSHSRSFCNQKDQHSYLSTHDTPRQLGMTSVVPPSGSAK